MSGAYGSIFAPLSFRTLQELYYIVMGIQYPITPLLITEHQWQIAGITTPVTIFTLLRREVVNIRFSSWTASRTNPAFVDVTCDRVRPPIVDDFCSVDVSDRFSVGYHPHMRNYCCVRRGPFVWYEEPIVIEPEIQYPKPLS